MEFNLTPEQKSLQLKVREFVQRELRPHEEQIEETDEFPKQLFKELRKRAVAGGFYSYNVPEAMGGMGFGMVDQCLLREEAGKTSSPLKLVLSGVPGVLMKCNEGAQRRKYFHPYLLGDLHTVISLTEPGSGSAAAELQTKARPDGDVYVVNGAKHLIASAAYTDFQMAIVNVERAGQKGGAPTLLLIDTDSPGIHMTRQPSMGLRGNTPWSVSYRNVEVPVTNRVQEEGDGMRLMMNQLSNTRLLDGATYVGLTEQLLAMAVEHARRRHTFGEPLIQRQAIQWMLSDIAVDIYALRSMVYSGAWEASQAKDIRIKAAMVKLYGAEMAFRTADNVMQIFGGIGYLRALPIERMWREARVARILSGTSEMQRVTIARYLGAHYEGDSKPSQLKPSSFDVMSAS